MSEPQQRRTTDSPLHGERLASLETEVKHISSIATQTFDALQEHAKDETHLFAEHSSAVQRLAVAQQHMQVAIDRIAAALEVLAEHGTRLAVLDQFRIRAEKEHESYEEEMKQTRDDAMNALEKVNRLYWLSGIALLLIQGLWALAINFNWF